ncbi:MAG: PIN domain-containing protein [Gaiellaceae bacterium]
MSYLLDTNVVSEIRKPIPNAGVAAWFAEADSADLHLSVLVVGEVRQGIERLRHRGDGRQAAVFERWLEVLKSEFGDRLLPVTTRVAERWGALNARRPLPVVDGLLAATAAVHELTLVTRDASLLAATGVRTLDPWR